MMQPRIVVSKEKKLVEKQLTMSVAKNRTGELWSNFMTCKKEIENRTTTEMISMQIYGSDYFKYFNPSLEFEKWATVEVSDFEAVPITMNSFILPSGLYAVFDYKGLSTDTRIYHYIFSTWLPGSNFTLDQRPHFEVLGAKYKNNAADSEEEIWIPIKEIS